MNGMNWPEIKAADLASIEKERLVLQQNLDAEKVQEERNRRGQFATPTKLSDDILNYAKTLIPNSETIRFLDPAFGTGSFYSALLRSFPHSRIERASGYEIDPHYGTGALRIWGDTKLELELADFTQITPPVLDSKKFNVVICNPPYVRHHHLSGPDKDRLRQLVMSQTGFRLNGLAGLYCYFLLLAQRWMAPDGLAGWLIPGEFLEVNYGHDVKKFLLEKVTLLHIHRFNTQHTQFEDALVSSVVVWFRNSPPQSDQRIKFTFGGSLISPDKSVLRLAGSLDPTAKWTWDRLDEARSAPRKTAEPVVSVSDLFSIKRGIATGANKFFILTARQIAEWQLPPACFQPILPSPRYLESEEIEADKEGRPQIEKQLFLLDCNLPEAVIREKYPSLWDYLQRGLEQEIHKRYLCRHRAPWYAQEQRPAAPILCTYMGRVSPTQANPFRFILNHSAATAPNVYLLLYPKPALARRLKRDGRLLRLIWQQLQQIAPRDLIAEGRVYGGGLHKLEPNELATAKLRGIDHLDLGQSAVGRQLSLF